MNTNRTYYFLVLLLLHLTYSCAKKEQIKVQSDCPDIIHSNYSDEYPDDYITINSVSLQDQEININVSHSGGCELHEYTLIQEPLFCGTPPIYISTRLSHNSNGDLCEASITEDLCFDLSSIYENFPGDEITIVLYNSHQSDTSWLIE